MCTKSSVWRWNFFKKGSLDSIPSPSNWVKIQILGGKVCLRCKGKTLLGIVKVKVMGSSPGYIFKCFLLYSSSECHWPNCGRPSVECSHLKKICRPLFVPEDIFFSFCLLTVNRSPFLIPFFNSFPYRTPRSNTAILSSKVYLLVWTADWW